MAGAKRWINSCAGGEHGGAFGYRPGGGGNKRPAMVATGYFCAMLLGMSPNSLQSMEAAAILTDSVELSTDNVYLAYYGALAAYQNQGQIWRDWRAKFHQTLVGAQAEDGSWNFTQNHGSAMGRVICTSLIALSLQAHYRYVPLYGLGFEPDPTARSLSARHLDELPPTPEFRRSRPLGYLNSPADDIEITATEHGDYLYFASNRKGGLGGFDLYRTRITGRRPTPPVNLGPAVNSKADEIDPDIRMAGFDLVFSTNREQEDTEKYRLFSATSRRVYRRHFYGKLPPPGWLLKTTRVHLIILLLAVGVFVFAFMRRKADRENPQEESAGDAV
jgi:hypothetical protein